MKRKAFKRTGIAVAVALTAGTFTQPQAHAQAPSCEGGAASFLGTNYSRGDNLRTFKLAIATTGEFTQHVGGKAAATAIINQRVKELNDNFGKELAVNFELIPSNDALIFADPNTDPWQDGTQMYGVGGQGHAPLENTLGVNSTSRPYEIALILGHPWGGGVAASDFAVVASGDRTSWVMRHELGHVLGHAHTNEYAPRQDQCYAVELPGRSRNETEGTSMGPNTHANFHSVSFHQTAVKLISGRWKDRGTVTPTGNTIPTVSAGPDHTIPHSTAFTLTATASDPDAGDQLTYVWDQMDVGGDRPFPPFAGTMDGVLFSRLKPTSSPSRSFPRPADLAANRYASNQEVMPTAARDLNFRLMVNDNHMFNNQPVSGINSDDVKITVAATGPFRVTSQNSAVTYAPGSITTVTWDVNGTNAAPFNAQNVKISLSSDGGLTFPEELLASTSNSGSAQVTLPNRAVDLARIKVEAIGNIFFDISDQNFAIGTAATPSGQRITQNISGTYRLRSKASQRTLHTNFMADQIVSSRFQTEDESSLFDLFQLPDGSYQLVSVPTDEPLQVRGANGGDRLLTSQPAESTDYSEFWIEEDADKSVRFVVKTSGRYLRLRGEQGGDEFVSTRRQDDTDWTRFLLEPWAPPITDPVTLNCAPGEVVIDGECEDPEEADL